MRKSFLAAMVAVFMIIGISDASAQRSATGGGDYTNAVGLGIEFGNGSTLVGPSFKHFFTENHVGNAELLFGDGIVNINAFYQYHKEIEGAAGLRWFAGGGPGVAFGNDNSVFRLTPMGGLDYKINGVPLSFSFDWRPTLFFFSGDSDFEAGRFGLGFRYAFN
jgi:hypothetical protein